MALAEKTSLQGGKYVIIRYISSGGFGVTYEGEHMLLHKRLAIKEFFVKDFCNRDETNNHVTVGTQSKVQLVTRLKQKFIEEAVALSHLSHRNIVNVSDVFEENGTAYYVMDYIDGPSLHEVVNSGGPLPEAGAVDYILQIANALKYVHAHHRLHLDIKPGNIMVDGDGRAVLIDFGSSKQYDEANGYNTSTLLSMTPGYAPVEQMGSRVNTFNSATDIYSLGATLYKLLTGITPPNSTDIADDETLLSPLPLSFSENTRNAVTKSMRIKRKERPQSMEEFIGLLTGELHPEPQSASMPLNISKRQSQAETELDVSRTVPNGNVNKDVPSPATDTITISELQIKHNPIKAYVIVGIITLIGIIVGVIVGVSLL